MTAEVIESKRKPPLWTVKAGGRYRASFMGTDAQAKAEAYAIEHHGDYTLKAKPMTAKEAARLVAQQEAG